MFEWNQHNELFIGQWLVGKIYHDIMVIKGETNIYKVSCYLPGRTGKNISRQTNYPTIKLAMNALEDLVRNWVKLASDGQE